MNDPIIKIDNVSFNYNHREVLANINLTVNKGDFLGVIGPNGGGKSTLIKLILGVLRPREGEVYLWGERVNKFKDWWRIGYVPQRAEAMSFHFPITVAETVDMGLVGAKPSGAKTVSQALQAVGLAGFEKRILNELSGGEQQRVFIARALVSNPELLVLDEPTAGVDAEAQEEFYAFLKKLNREMKLTLIMVSHDVDVVVNEVTMMVCINKQMVCHVPPHEFVKGDYLEKTYGKDMKMVVHGH